MKHKSDRLMMLLAMVIFGTIGLVRNAIPLPSAVIALARGGIGTLFLLAFRLLRGKHFSWELLKKNLPVLCASGVLIGANWILLFEAYRYTTVAAATMAYYMAPVLVVFASPFILGEKLTGKKTICCLAAVVGMVFVSGVTQNAISGYRGILLGLGAALLYAIVILLNQFIRELSAEERTIAQLAFATAALLPYVLLTCDLRALTFDGMTLCLLLLAGILHTGIAYTLYFGSMKTLPAQTVAIFSYLDPVVAVLLSVLVLKEEMQWLPAIGVGMILVSMLISEYSRDKKPHAVSHGKRQ